MITCSLIHEQQTANNLHVPRKAYIDWNTSLGTVGNYGRSLGPTHDADRLCLTRRSYCWSEWHASLVTALA